MTPDAFTVAGMPPMTEAEAERMQRARAEVEAIPRTGGRSSEFGPEQRAAIAALAGTAAGEAILAWLEAEKRQCEQTIMTAPDDAVWDLRIAWRTANGLQTDFRNMMYAPDGR